MDVQLLLTSVISLLTIAIAVMAIFWKRQTERIKIIEKQISQNKYKAYSELVAVFYDLVKNMKANKKTNDNELMEKLINSKRDLLIYGSDKVFLKFVKWLSYASANPGDNAHFKLFLDLLIEIRKDMGNEKTKLTGRDIMISLMQSVSEYEKIKPFVE